MRNALSVTACEAVLLDLLAQVRKFCEEQGEADFETGAAEAMKRQIVGQQVDDYLQRQLDKLLSAYNVAAPAPSAPADQPSPDKQGQQGELLQQALDALETANNGLKWYQDRCPEAASGADDEADEQIHAAIIGLQEALASSPASATEEPIAPQSKQGAA